MDTMQLRIAKVESPTQVRLLQNCPALHSFEWENSLSRNNTKTKFVKIEVAHEFVATDSLLGNN